MIAISLWQPHAFLISIGAKPLETREWAPPVKDVPRGYPIPIAIHAAKTTDELESIARRVADLKKMHAWPPREEGFLKSFYDVMDEWMVKERLPNYKFSDFPLGAIVATGTLTGCYNADKVYPRLKGHARHFGDFAPGRYAWHIQNVKPLPRPIPARGQKGLWEWTQP